MSVSTVPILLKSGCTEPIVSPPSDGFTVGGKIILCWTYNGELTEDEYFDIRVKPKDSNDSVFTAWTKEKRYELNPWSSWSENDYILQIGIIKGYYEGEKEHFISDTGRDSESLLIKWRKDSGGSGGSNGGGAGIN
jgi:hypothetical protein